MSSTAAGIAETQPAAAAISAEDREGNQATNGLQNGGYESERRAQRRQRHELEKEEAKQWEIIKSLSDISAEVELLTQEVSGRRLLCCLAQLLKFMLRTLISYYEASGLIRAIFWPMTILHFHRLPGYGMGFSLLQSSRGN